MNRPPTQPPQRPETPEPGATSEQDSSTPTAPQGRKLPPPPAGGRGLPLHVDQVDRNVTRVTPAAYQTPAPPPTRPQRPPAQSSMPSGYPPARPGYAPPGQASIPTVVRPKGRGISWMTNTGCLLRAVFASLFVIVMAALCGVSIMFFQYYRIASTLPNISDLRNRASQFETTRIYDRNGSLLYEILDPTAGRRTYIPLKNISPYLVAATIATEDKGFYSHPGFDLMAIFRAFWQNYQSGETVSGASTITQQLARSLLLSPEERVEQTYDRKLREAILASEITRRYSKDQILELYLNEIFYGNLSYGIEAAAETYFNTTADQLTIGQAAFLAGLPQTPAVYDIYTNPEAVFARMEDVLVLMYQASQDQGCIYVSNSTQRVCVDPVVVVGALDEIKQYPFSPPVYSQRYPHWVNFVRSQLEIQYDPQTIYRSGFRVYTTLDPVLQDAAQNAISQQVQSMAANRAVGGALVAIRPATGEILAMVGSPDFYNEAASGQVNMATSPRQPGSSMKPLTYTAAFEKGWTPGTLIWDVPTEFSPSGLPNDPSPPYVPVNYDGRFHGPVTVRSALANSYNIPAVKTLNFVGIYDNPETSQPDGFINFARRMGITTLERQDYGLSLTLGGGEVTLLELTGAYATYANMGRRVPPTAILRILDSSGNEVFAYQPPAGEQVIRSDHAFLISSILADNDARAPAFGANSVLRLPFTASVKTGTTNDFRDNWTLGYTPDIAIGVWIGNPDYTPMVNTSGLSGAAPVWASVMQAAIQQVAGGNPSPFQRPPGLVDQIICAISGTLPSQWCPQQRSETFAADQPPLPKEKDLWQKVVVDTWTGLLASPACRDFVDEKAVINVSDESARRWLRRDPAGQTWAERMGFPRPLVFAPNRECRADDPRPQLSILAPRNADTLNFSPVGIYVLADATQGFGGLRLEFGLGEKPVEWKTLYQGQQKFNQPEMIHNWDISDLPGGVVTLRLTMFSVIETYAQTQVRLLVQLPTPTPTETPMPLPTETPTPEETPTPTITPTPWFILPTWPFPTP